MYARILVPLDGSALAERVLPDVEALARALRSTLILLRVTRTLEMVVAELTAASVPIVAPVEPPIDPTLVVEGEREEAAGYLAKVADDLRATGLRVQIEIPEGPVAEAIVRRAAELGVDLIAMTTHGRGGLGRLIFGSVAEEVLRKGPCPILLVRVREDKPSQKPASG